MNTRRLVVLLLAAVAAGGAALLVRGLLGGGTTKVDARPDRRPSRSATCWLRRAICSPANHSRRTVQWQKWPSEQCRSRIYPADGRGLGGCGGCRHGGARADRGGRTDHLSPRSCRSDAERLHGGDAATRHARRFHPRNDRVRRRRLHPAQQPRRYHSYRDHQRHAQARALARRAFRRARAGDRPDHRRARNPVSDAKTATLELTPDQVETMSRAQVTGACPWRCARWATAIPGKTLRNRPGRAPAATPTPTRFRSSATASCALSPANGRN